MNRYDVVVVGAGANGLAAAALLAKARRRILVLERSERVGGTNATEEMHPGFRINACRDDAGWVPEALVRELQLTQHGLVRSVAPAGLVSLSAAAPAVATYADTRRTVDDLRAHSAADASRWAAFCAFVGGAAGFLETAYAMRPPRVQSRALGDLLALAGLGRRLRRLGKREMMEVLRVVPMPVSDLAEEWFESESLRALLAVAGTRDLLQGPMSGGTALVFLHHQVGAPPGTIGLRRVVRGGTGALVMSLAAAARAAGVEIRLGAEVTQVVVEGGRAAGVVLTTGEEIRALEVLSSADPRRSFDWVDPKWLDPELVHAVDQVRMRGATARVHFALDALPRLESGGREVPRDALGGTLVMAPALADVERASDAAKYGAVPDAPALSITIPTLLDPSLAPQRQHVMSVTVHHVPWARVGGWDDGAAGALGDKVAGMISTLAPRFGDHVLKRQVLTPTDLEARYACTRGSLMQGELALDQFLFMRPVPQCARYATPLPGFWLGGTGSHPANAGGGGGLLAARELLASRGAR